MISCYAFSNLRFEKTHLYWLIPQAITIAPSWGEQSQENQTSNEACPCEVAGSQLLEPSLLSHRVSISSKLESETELKIKPKHLDVGTLKSKPLGQKFIPARPSARPCSFMDPLQAVEMWESSIRRWGGRGRG